jgi:hypothetical protein
MRDARPLLSSSPAAMQQVAAYEQQFQEALSFMQTAFSELSLTYAEAFSGTSPAKLPSDFSPTTRSFKMVAECTVTCERGVCVCVCVCVWGYTCSYETQKAHASHITEMGQQTKRAITVNQVGERRGMV